MLFEKTTIILHFESRFLGYESSLFRLIAYICNIDMRENI